MKSKLASIIIAATATVFAMPALAHHSIAAFDRDNPLVVAGTVKEFHLSNPHAWIHLLVPNDKGGEDEWALEGTAAAGLLRMGYTKYTLKPGEKVRVLIAPRRDGGFGGEWQRTAAAARGAKNL